MIEPRELRLNSPVLFKDEIYFVEELMRDNLYVVNDKLRHLTAYDSSLLQPIPLNEKILIELGFIEAKEERQYYIRYKRNGDDTESLFIVGLEYQKKGMIYYGICNSVGTTAAINSVECLHKLQNAVYEITGEELTLKQK